MTICWFCGGDNAGSQEHIFPKWLNEAIPGQLGPRVDVNETQETMSGPVQRKWQRTGPAQETVRSVCPKCNNGWMSQLENEAKPVLSSVIEGKTSTLQDGDLILIATWATKTAMVIESRNSSDQQISTFEMRKTLMNDKRPPASIQVDIFAFEAEPLSGYWRHAAAVAGSSTRQVPKVPNYAVTVMVFGRLGLRVVDDQASWRNPLSGNKAPGIPGMICIYPSLSTLSWPLDRVLDKGDLEAVRMGSMAGDVHWLTNR